MASVQSTLTAAQLKTIITTAQFAEDVEIANTGANLMRVSCDGDPTSVLGFPIQPGNFRVISPGSNRVWKAFSQSGTSYESNSADNKSILA